MIHQKVAGFLGDGEVLSFIGQQHPMGEEGFCSVCKVDTLDGVLMTKNPKHTPFYFFCLDCARRIGEAAVR
jgi:hypothetical protein